jgi:hypothetical protein
MTPRTPRPPAAAGWAADPASPRPGDAATPASPPAVNGGLAGNTPGAPAFQCSPAGVPGPRTWMVPLPHGTPLLTSNHRLHHMALYRKNQELHDIAITLARKYRLPQIDRAAVVVEYRRPAHRHPLASSMIRDAGALAPMGKALIDGLVKAGVFPGDTVRHVVSEEYRFADERTPLGQVVIRITEVLR